MSANERDKEIVSQIACPIANRVEEYDPQKERERVEGIIAAYREEIQAEDARLFSGLAVVNKELAEKEHERAEKAERERDTAINLAAARGQNGDDLRAEIKTVLKLRRNAEARVKELAIEKDAYLCMVDALETAQERVKELEERLAPPSDFAKRMAIELLEAIDNRPAIETRDEWLGAVEAAIDMAAKERLRELPDKMWAAWQALPSPTWKQVLFNRLCLRWARRWLRREVGR